MKAQPSSRSIVLTHRGKENALSQNSLKKNPIWVWEEIFNKANMVFNARHEIRRGIFLALKSETEEKNKGENEGKDDLQKQEEASRVNQAMRD